jgi:hypothetical protein
MKIKVFILVFGLIIISCKNKTEKMTEYSEENLDVIISVYPERISKVFDVHGGLDKWNTMKSLEFTVKKPNVDEVTIANLKNRKSLIEMPSHFIGYNGEDVWLKNKDTAQYKGNPRFYYNLMFYFYAMPFVLADDGINYQDVEPLVFEGKTYLGIKISYESGVGESSEDEYKVYYDPETNKMTWLGYTVTYFSKEKSKKFNFIKYSNWQTLEGLVLPETLTWYENENNLPTTKRNNLLFTDVKLSKETPEIDIFEVPDGAQIIE